MSETQLITKRHDWVDAARGVCIILVVSMHFDEMHFSNLQVPELAKRFWDYLTSIARPARMPTFFLISGFLASTAISKEFWEVFEKRFLKLYYLYLVWAFIAVLALWVLFRELSLDSIVDFSHRILAELFYPRTQLWFIYGLIIFFWIAYTCRNSQGALLASALVASVFSEQIEQNVLSQMLRTFPYFLIGVYAPKLVLDIVNQMTPRITCCAVMAYAFCLVPIMMDNDFPGVWLPATVVGILIVLALSKFLSGRILFLEYIGRNTLPIYVMHSILILAANVLLADADFEGGQWMMLYPLFGILAVLFLCLLIFNILSRCGGRWLFELPVVLSNCQPRILKI